MAKNPALVYQLKVTLDHTRPPIWRRIQVAEDTTLRRLHDILQIVMGWEDSHLHSFTIGGQNYSNPEYDAYGDFGAIDENRVKLKDLGFRQGSRFRYEYDFGDSWDHTLLVEKVLPPEEGLRYPVCVKGKRACPPEDVGGVWGYENFLEAIRNPNHAEHDQYLEWFGGEFDPEAFDIDGINQDLRAMGKGRSAGRDSAWTIDEDLLARNTMASHTPWVQNISPDQSAVIEALPLRRDTLTLLTYLRDHRPTGTQSTGNLPLKAVREIASRFVNPPRLDDQIGDRIYPVRSETEVWPVYFVHVMASVSGLVEGAAGRRWKLTLPGEQFLEASPPAQVWQLLTTWWFHVNWQIAYPFEFGGSTSTPQLPPLVLISLLALPAEERIPFDRFVDALIERANLTWPAQDQSYARQGLSFFIRSTVINPLADFAVLEPEFAPAHSGIPGYFEVRAFKVTDLGRGMLEAVEAEIHTPEN